MGFVGAVVVVDEEDGLYIGVVGMVVDELEAFVQSHDHECRCHGIGIPGFVADNRITETTLIYRCPLMSVSVVNRYLNN